MTSVATYQATIYLAGDADKARDFLRDWAWRHGFCATVTPTTFVYTAGEETGVAVGIVNYPRFPSTPEAIFDSALRVARALVVALCQRTALVVGTDRTEWILIEPPGLRDPKLVAQCHYPESCACRTCANY